MFGESGKKIFFTILAALTISGFIIICTMGQSVHRHKVETKTEAIAAAEKEAPMYTVREHEGRIAVFRGSDDSPYKFIDFDMSLLSDFDRQQLSEGIALNSDAELKAYIQDMTS